MNMIETSAGTTSAKDGRSTRWEEHRRTKRRELTTAALRAIRRNGAHVGMEEIAQAAGTSKTVYYRHFHDRAGLWSAVVDRTVDFIYDRLPVDNPDGVEVPDLVSTLADAYLSLVERDPEIYEFVTSGPGSGGAHATGIDHPVINLTSRIGVKLTDHLRARGYGDKSAVWAQAIVGAIWAAADRWVELGRVTDKDVVVAQIHALFTSGLHRHTGRPADNSHAAYTTKEFIMTSPVSSPTTHNDPAATALGAALSAALDGDFHEFKQQLRTTLDADILVRPHDQSLAEAREWTFRSLKALAGTGYNNVGMPEEYGGTHTLAHSIAAFEILAMGDLSLTIKSGVQTGLFGGAILNLGNEEQKKRWLPGVMNLDIPGCYGMTELGRGSDVQSLETTITYLPESQEFEVHTPTDTARKAYIGNAAEHGIMAAIFGQLIVAGENHGVHCIIVSIRDSAGAPLSGVTLGDHGVKGGLAGVDNGTMAFDHVRVPRENLLDRYGHVSADGVYSSPIERRGQRFSTMLSTLVRGRISVGGAASSAARRGLTIAVRHALQRTQFHKPTGEPVTIMEYQLHQRKLVPELAKAYAFGFAQNELMKHYQAAQDQGATDETKRELETRAAGLKGLQTRWANDTLQVCREACGGFGFMAENGVTSLRADADVFATFEGDNTVLQMLVGRALLADFKSSWSELDLIETARKSAALVGNRILERTTAKATIDRLVSIASRKPVEQKIYARGWQVEMLEYREKRIVEALGLRMREVLKLEKEEQFAALNLCQNHMADAATAHMERVVLEAFIEGISNTNEGPARDMLIRLCDLYSLSTIKNNAVWYLERSIFDGARSKEISLAVERLSAELTDNIADIVAGLGVPEKLLNSALVTQS